MSSPAIPAPPADASATARGLVSTGAQTFAGAKTFSGSVSAPNITAAEAAIVALQAASHAAVTLGAVGSSPNANGASLSGQVLSLQPADGANPGSLTAGAQTIGGAKTFNGAVISAVASGNNAFSGVQGARWAIGGGSTYFYSDGSSIITPSQLWITSGSGIYLNAAGTRRIYDDGSTVAVNAGFTVSTTLNVGSQIQFNGTAHLFPGSAFGAGFTGALGVRGAAANGATAVAVLTTNFPSLTTAGAEIHQWSPDNGTTIVASIDKDGAVQLNRAGGTRPSADAAQRGKLWYTKAAGGVADKIEICLKDAADAYSWVQIKP